MNTFEMARRVLVNDLIESARPEVRLQVIAEMVKDLEVQARALRVEAEALLARHCCDGKCNQGRDCPLRRTQ